MRQIAQSLEDLGRLRNQADYQLDQPGAFSGSTDTAAAIQEAQAAIALLDAIDADPARRATAVADVKKTLPPTP